VDGSGEKAELPPIVAEHSFSIGGVSTVFATKRMELRQLAVSPRPTEVIMQHRAAALLFALVVAAACTAPATDEATSRAEADPIAVREAIDAVNAGFSAGLEAGDVEALVAYYDPEAVVMPPNVPGSRGTAAIREGLAGMLSAMTITDMTFTTHDVHVAGDMAVETGAYSMTSQPKDGSAPASTDTGKFLVVWRQQADGSWKLFRDIFNSDLPLPAATH
jgi:uncharacterized protein (TIGR02246 family)